MTGSGTVLDPYIISDVDDLQAMNDDLAAYYELGQDIDASATVGWNAGAGFAPVGSLANLFTGSLDGKGYTIDSLFINRPATNKIGLFGYADGATVANVTMTNVDITGLNNTGGLIGSAMDATISSCSVSGAITGRSNVGGLVGYSGNLGISSCNTSGTVTGSGNEVGGLVGWLSGSIENSYSTAAVSGRSIVGGLCGGFPGSTMSDCYATGDVTTENGSTGGLVGYAAGTISRCYATGNVGPTGSHNGGLIGYCGVADITRCFATGDVTGDNRVGGFVGSNAWGDGAICTIANCYARGNITAIGYGAAGFVSLHNASWGVGGGATLDNCYSTGAVSCIDDPAEVGGLVYENNGVVTDSFWDFENSGVLVSAGGTPKTTAEMKTKTTFTDAGWNFNTIWHLLACNDGYPCLLNITPLCVIRAARHHPIHAIIPNIPYRRPKPELTLAGG